MKIQSQRFFDETWDAEFWLVWPVQNKELDRFLERTFGIKDKTTDGPFTGRFITIREDDDEELAGVIGLKQWRSTPEGYSTLVHECLHAVRWFLKNRGIELSGKTEETYAYFLDSMVRRCAERLNKRRPR